MLTPVLISELLQFLRNFFQLYENILVGTEHSHSGEHNMKWDMIGQ
jgi:hypothetical protein